MSGRWVRVVGALVLAVVPLVAACGPAGRAAPASHATTAAAGCHDQWHDVADSVLGLDQDPAPSSLASRWTTVIATVDYYENSTSVKDCAATVQSQVAAISALRAFSDRLRPYDMAYQLKQVSATVDLYLHDPVPSPAPGTGAHGKPVPAPTHRQVSTALATLTAEADAANAELQPGWEQLASVSLDDDAAVKAALADLDSLAQAGEHWRRCQQALQVIVAAQRAQEGLLGQPEDAPSD